MTSLIKISVPCLFLTSLALGNINTIGVNGVNGKIDSAGEYIAPYSGPFNGVTTTIYCDDLVHNIYLGATPTPVNVSTINNLSLTRFGSLPNAKADYEQIFYLSTFLGNTFSSPSTYYPTFAGGISSANSTVNADIQNAIWSYFAPTQTENAGTNQVDYWVTKAAANYANYSYGSYRILTDSANRTNGVQELFINTNPSNVLTPEPSQMIILAAGMGALGIFVRRRKLARRTA